MVSTKCTMTRADVTRVARNSVSEFVWNQRIRNPERHERQTASTIPDVGSSSTSAMPVNTM